MQPGKSVLTSCLGLKFDIYLVTIGEGRRMSVFDVCGLLIVIKVELLYGGLYYNIRVYTHHRIHHRLVNTGKIVYTLKRLVRIRG